MREKIGGKRAIGFYFIILAGVMAIVSFVRFVMWAPAHDAMDAVIIAALVAGVALDVVLMIWDNDYLVILATACYSLAVAKFLSDSVGSFVDALQGIHMFGDSAQVGTILSISAGMAVSVVLSMVAGFLKRGRK